MKNWNGLIHFIELFSQFLTLNLPFLATPINQLLCVQYFVKVGLER